MKNMKVRNCLLLPVIFIAIFLFHSCNEEEPLGPSLASFSSDVQHVTEGDMGKFALTFSEPTPYSGTLVVRVSGNAVYDEDYTTVPELVNGVAAISVGKGNTTFHFTVYTHNNTFAENSKYIAFTMEQIPRGTSRGAYASHTLIVDDDEAPSIADFKEMYMQVDEKNADGVVVKIRLSQPVQGAGAIAVDLAQFDEPNMAVYGKHFTTIPAATGNRIILGAAQGDTLISFKFIPIDNALFEEDKGVQFQFSSFSGAVQKGTYTTCWVTMRSDEVSEATFDDSDVTINEDDYKGVVVKVSLSKPIPMESRMNIDAGFLPNDLHFITKPDLQFTNALRCYGEENCDYELYYFLPVTLHPNTTSLEFRIIPINNQSKDGNHVYNIYLSPLQPYITASNSLKLTILDDD